MGFLDKLKSTAGNAMAAASDAARNVQDKGKEMTEKARLLREAAVGNIAQWGKP